MSIETIIFEETDTFEQIATKNANEQIKNKLFQSNERK